MCTKCMTPSPRTSPQQGTCRGGKKVRALSTVLASVPETGRGKHRECGRWTSHHTGSLLSLSGSSVSKQAGVLPAAWTCWHAVRACVSDLLHPPVQHLRAAEVSNADRSCWRFRSIAMSWKMCMCLVSFSADQTRVSNGVPRPAINNCTTGLCESPASTCWHKPIPHRDYAAPRCGFPPPPRPLPRPCRFAIWPRVRDFIMGLPAGAVVADVGCGNGKYFGVRQDLAVIGSDRSTGAGGHTMLVRFIFLGVRLC